MSVFLKKLCLKKNLNIYKVFQVVYREDHHWFPQYKPGPYPKTPKEREEAAKKYNLLPEEYEPYPDDGNGLGDYPMLPKESGDVKDPFYPFDNMYDKRDYLEPLHRHALLLQPELFSTAPSQSSNKKLAINFVIVWGSIFLFCYILNQYELHSPVLKKQIWEPNAVHYTFELDHSQKPPPPVPVEPSPPSPPTSKFIIPVYFTFNKEKLKF